MLLFLYFILLEQEPTGDFPGSGSQAPLWGSHLAWSLAIWLVHFHLGDIFYLHTTEAAPVWLCMWGLQLIKIIRSRAQMSSNSATQTKSGPSPGSSRSTFTMTFLCDTGKVVWFPWPRFPQVYSKVGYNCLVYLIGWWWEERGIIILRKF